MNQAANEDELEALTRRHQGEKLAQGLLAEANLREQQAARKKARAAAGQARGLVGAGTGLLTAGDRF